ATRGSWDSGRPRPTVGWAGAPRWVGPTGPPPPPAASVPGQDKPLHHPPDGRAGAAPPASADAIEFRRVAVAFTLPNGACYRAVAATDMAVGPREFVAIVGPTGCGKSTFLNVAARLQPPTARTGVRPRPPLIGPHAAPCHLLP